MTGPQTGQHFAGYLLEEIAGEGPMAVVYRARHPYSEQTVGVMVFRSDAAEDNELRRRLTGDAAANAIRHPHVLRILGSGEEEGRLYMVMQYVDGPTLRDVLAQEGGRLAPALAATVVAQAAEGLDAAHAAGLVHRSITPKSIRLERDLEHPHAYVTDFALSRELSRQTRVTQIGTLVGLSPYVSPEAVIGTRELDARADVYSLGCVLFECLTGSVPFPSENEIMGVFARTSQEAPSVSEFVDDLDPRWDEVLAGALATDPDDRLHTAGELGRAARAIAAV